MKDLLRTTAFAEASFNIISGPTYAPVTGALRRQPGPGWGTRRLARFKTVNGKRLQLHATRGWKFV